MFNRIVLRMKEKEEAKIVMKIQEPKTQQQNLIKSTELCNIKKLYISFSSYNNKSTQCEFFSGSKL